MRFFSSVRSIAAASLVLGLLAGRSADAGAQPSSIRSRAVLELRIDAKAYRATLGDAKSAELARALADTAMAIVRELYPFVDWTGPTPPADTVDIRVVDKYEPDVMPWSRLRLTIRAGKEIRMRDSASFIDLEDYAHAFSRRIGSSAWQVPTLVFQIAPKLRDALGSTTAFGDVFSRIPLRAPATITRDGHGVVPVRPADIGASDAPDSQNPTFRVLARVVDPSRAEIAELALTPCYHGRGAEYNCDVTRLDFFRAGATILPPQLATTLRDGTVEPRALMVTSFQRDPHASRGGTVFPRP